jgi:cytochrome c556
MPFLSQYFKVIFFLGISLFTCHAFAQEVQNIRMDPVPELITDTKNHKMILQKARILPVEAEQFAYDKQHPQEGVYGTESDVVYRQNIMIALKALKDNLEAILKEEAGNQADIASTADALVAQASLVSSAFIPDTRAVDMETKVDDKLWHHMADFLQKADLFAEQASLFAEKAAQEESVSLKDLKSLKQQCTACHQVYRQSH